MIANRRARRPDNASAPLRSDQTDAGNRSRREDDSREISRPLPTASPPPLPAVSRGRRLREARRVKSAVVAFIDTTDLLPRRCEIASPGTPTLPPPTTFDGRGDHAGTRRRHRADTAVACTRTANPLVMHTSRSYSTHLLPPKPTFADAAPTHEDEGGNYGRTLGDPLCVADVARGWGRRRQVKVSDARCPSL